VIVVYPYQVVLTKSLLCNAIKRLVGTLEGFPRPGIVIHIVGKIMEQRPKGLVAILDIVITNNLFGEVHRVKPITFNAIAGKFLLSALPDKGARPPYP